MKETDCVLRKRVGELLALSDSTLPSDYWWKLDDDPARAGAEVATVLRSRVLPYLDSINSLESLREAVAEKAVRDRRDVLSTIYLAILTAMLGDLRKAKELLHESRSSVPDAWKPRIEHVLVHLPESAQFTELRPRNRQL